MDSLLARVVRKTHKPKDVRRLRIYIFLKILRADNEATDKRRAIDDALKQMKTIKHIRETRLRQFFAPAEIRRVWEKANALFIKSYTDSNTSVATDGGVTCHICMENVSDFLLVHGGSAHGGVCGACALRIILDGHKCPFCTKRVKAICARDVVRVTKGGESLQIFDN